MSSVSASDLVLTSSEILQYEHRGRAKGLELTKATIEAATKVISHDAANA